MNFKKTVKKVLPNNFYISLKTLSQVGCPFPYRKYAKKHQCIFIHIPKTAGTSVLSVLMQGNVLRDHAVFSDFQTVDPVSFQSYFKFCFVRNPYDRAVSCYEYLKKGGNGGGDLYYKDLIEQKFPTFDDFVLNYLNKDIIHQHVLFKPQYLFIYNYKSELQVDYIGKFEDIEEDFKYISEKIFLQKKLPDLNKSSKKNYMEYYSNSLVKEKVNWLYSKDFELLGYTNLINKY